MAVLVMPKNLMNGQSGCSLENCFLENCHNCGRATVMFGCQFRFELFGAYTSAVLTKFPKGHSG